MSRGNIAVLYTTKPLVDRMLEVARAVAEEEGFHIVAEWSAAGSLEQPLQAKRLLMDSNVDGVVVLGIIRSGETKHGIVIAQSIVDALVRLQLEFMKPVTLGIIGPDAREEGLDERLEYYAAGAVRALRANLTE